MQRDEALAILRAHREEIFTRFPVKKLALFGSTVRNEASETSDVDVLVEFEGPTTFDGYFDLKFYLEEVLQREVDLVCAKAVRPRIKPYIEREALDVA
ncbi:nucleotidyltransferase family protein [Geoalkalibacter halelectricus]|uniref:Nucleotidyltransferase family protein n=1 Tax=Geoalkalibacter halelectricus TaxID=2847045 RepID=A0ABY5ZNI6_9BACT|nr:nucleotidyltransferase family protein [Geoalkalibacter halelectricus]MDO3377529.1 nucleotidyltransferase family protein [Geoalkalibacter halelectricus]UWZ80712.1 nucleotidyltransferase family protein [Geoalkalibacter halelectricus]